MEHASTDLDMSIQDIYEMACSFWLSARENPRDIPAIPPAYPHGNEILGRLGEAYWESPEPVRKMLSGMLNAPDGWWEELRPAGKKRKAK